MALVMPLVLVLLLGIVDLGKAFNYWNDANQIAATGARFAAVNKNPGNAATSLQEWLRLQGDTAELRDGGTDAVPSAASVCINTTDVNGDGTIAAGDSVTVTVKSNYSWIPFLRSSQNKLSNGFTQVTLKGRATMRLEAAPTAYVPTGSCA
jgi:Flp pilus assembly protein TadG